MKPAAKLGLHLKLYDNDTSVWQLLHQYGITYTVGSLAGEDDVCKIQCMNWL